jgi:SOS response regulatory protein OraA/RecX
VRRKLFAYLARRGFSSDIIRECVEELIGEEEKGDEEEEEAE